MKKIMLFALLGGFLFTSCQKDDLSSVTELDAVEAKNNINSNRNDDKEKDEGKICKVVDADRCPLGDQQPTANFWWPDNPFTDNFFTTEAFFGTTANNHLTFTEYPDGTAHISGSTAQILGDCIVEVDIWFKDKVDWATWSADGGAHKKEGCAGLPSDETEMVFYVIDETKSTITSSGSNCLGEGTYGVRQRPDPDDLGTPNFGAHVGPGGANFDSDTEAIGLSTWGWITDISTGEDLWVMDFNFKIECEEECETAFGYRNGESDDFCSTQEFERWGWTTEVNTNDAQPIRFEIWAAAGQCDLSKGTWVGYAEVSFSGGDIIVEEFLEDGFTINEKHVYAGTSPYPFLDYPETGGAYTVAPGQYYVEENLSGTINVILHYEVCGEFDED